jgi:hypothetical protein
VIATPEGEGELAADEAEAAEERRGGIASPDGATIEVNFDWE